MAKTPEVLYQERIKRVQDAIELRKPDRVPIVALFGFFPAKYTGITCEDAMYDYDKSMKAWVDTIVEFKPDMDDNPFPQRVYGRILDILDTKQLAWPGHGIDPDRGFQFIEKDYMKAEEYEAFMFDQTDFMLRNYWPRIFGTLGPFENLPPIHSIYSYGGLARFASFGTPEMKDALEALIKVGDEAKELVTRATEFDETMQRLGFPSQYGAVARAPFDIVSDFLRGTVGTMLDMFRTPDKLLEIVEQFVPIEIKAGLAAKNSGVPRVFMPLHKCIDTFMSPEQFDTFYWPTLQKVILALIDEGLNPMVFWEGDCTSRLETIKDIPAGKAVYWFEKTDMIKAKEVLGDVACIRGNVPLSILCAGTPDDVKNYCKELIDNVGRGGGFIMDASTQFDDAKPENVKAMFEFTKEYGQY